MKKLAVTLTFIFSLNVLSAASEFTTATTFAQEEPEPKPAPKPKPKPEPKPEKPDAE